MDLAGPEFREPVEIFGSIVKQVFTVGNLRRRRAFPRKHVRIATAGQQGGSGENRKQEKIRNSEFGIRLAEEKIRNSQFAVRLAGGSSVQSKVLHGGAQLHDSRQQVAEV